MITYLYWIFFFSAAFAAVYLLGSKGNWRWAGISAATLLFVGWAAYYFHFEQVFVKRFGGVMAISIPDGQQHIATTWKDDNLWVENFDPKTNTCYFYEYSKGNVLEGKVVIKHCNPVGWVKSP